MAILDADKEGFLRNRTSLIQTVGRAARNVNGRAILYGEKTTASMAQAIDETARRRTKQEAYNVESTASRPRPSRSRWTRRSTSSCAPAA